VEGADLIGARINPRLQTLRNSKQAVHTPQRLTLLTLLSALLACDDAPEPPEPAQHHRRRITTDNMWQDPAARHIPQSCPVRRHHTRHEPPFDAARAAAALSLATKSVAEHTEDLRRSLECYRAANGFTICVTRATAQFGGLTFGTRDALYHRHPSSTSRDGTTRLYGLHDPLKPNAKRPYSDCALNPEHEPATQGCLSIRDGQASLQCGEALVALEKIEAAALAGWLPTVPLYYPPLVHNIIRFGQLHDGTLAYRDSITVNVAYRDRYLSLISSQERLAIGEPGSMQWIDPRLTCEHCEIATPITDEDTINLWRATLPDLSIGWPAHDQPRWAGECEVFDNLSKN
jgi:hypothetical protein